MFKYACLNPIAQVGLDHFTDQFEKTDNVNEAEAILVRSADMHDMEFSEKLLAVARAGAGVNNIPTEELAKKAIVVFNTPGANANGVKELVLAALFLSSRNIVGGIEWGKENISDPNALKRAEKEKKQFTGHEIAGKKLGIIGLGAIGQLVANAAIHLGMEVYGYDPYISIDAAWNLSRSIKHIKNVNDIYSQCDYITIHVPALDSTKGMIGEEAISLMKPNAVVLNYARDVLVDEQAMVKALKEGRVARYCTDFASPALADAPNVMVTPHLGASTFESEDNCAVMAVRELRNYLLEGNIRNSVNYPNCDLGPCVTAGRVAVYHLNQPAMISAFTTVIGEEKINIQNIINKSKGDFAYTLIDTDSEITDHLMDKLSKAKGVVKVRRVK